MCNIVLPGDVFALLEGIIISLGRNVGEGTFLRVEIPEEESIFEKMIDEDFAYCRLVISTS